MEICNKCHLRQVHSKDGKNFKKCLECLTIVKEAGRAWKRENEKLGYCRSGGREHGSILGTGYKNCLKCRHSTKDTGKGARWRAKNKANRPLSEFEINQKSREDAIKNELKYYDGAPCKKDKTHIKENGKTIRCVRGANNDGGYMCYLCDRKNSLLWEKNNRQKIRDKHKRLSKNQKAKDKRNSRQREQWQNDPFHRLSNNVRRGIHAFLKDGGSSKDGAAWKTFTEWSHLELIKKFDPLLAQRGWTWANYGNVWHIDHIIPRAWFHRCILGQVELKVKSSYDLENLQPLTGSENCQKNDEIAEEAYALMPKIIEKYNLIPVPNFGFEGAFCWREPKKVFQDDCKDELLWYNTVYRDILTSLSRDLILPKYKEASIENEYAGLCYVISECFYHIMGGKEASYQPMHINHEDSSHWWIRGPNGEIFDFTRDRFESPVPYEQSKPSGFLSKEPSERTKILINRIENFKAA